MSNETVKVKRIPPHKNKDPLNDMATLNKIGRAATKEARARAFENGASVTIAVRGTYYRLNPDGTKTHVLNHRSPKITGIYQYKALKQ